MRLPRLILFLWIALAFCNASAFAETPSQVKTRDQVAKLIAQGHLDFASRLAEHQLDQAFYESGQNSLPTAYWLNQLGIILQTQGNYPSAQSHFLRSLDIRQGMLGRNHTDVALTINNIALMHEKQGHFKKAEVLFNRALTINQRALGRDHPQTVSNVSNLGLLKLTLGDLAAAEKFLLESLNATTRVEGSQSNNTATSYANLGALYITQQRFSEAAVLLQQALALDERRYGANHPLTAIALNNLGELFRLEGHFTKAEEMFQRAVSIDKAALGPNSPDYATDLTNLAAVFRDTGRISKATQCLQEAITIFDQALPNQHPAIAVVLTDLAAIYQDTGRLVEAEQLYDRAIRINDSTFGLHHPNTVGTIENLAKLYAATNREAKAVDLLQAVLATNQDAYGANSHAVALTKIQLAEVLGDFSQNEDAIKLAEQAINIFRGSTGPQSIHAARAMEILARAHFASKHEREAAHFINRALKIYRADLPKYAGETGLAYYWQSRIQLKAGLPRQAFASAKSAVEIFQHRHATTKALSPLGRTSELMNRKDVYLQLLRAAHAASSSKADLVANEWALIAANLSLTDETANAIGFATLQFKARGTEHIRLLRLQQKHKDQIPILERQLIAALGTTDRTTHISAKDIRKKIEAANTQLTEIDRALRKTHPTYASYFSATTLSLKQMQAALAATEAIVVLLPDEDQTFILAASGNKSVLISTPMGKATLTEHVNALRQQLDPQQWTGSFAPYDRNRAYLLYQKLLAPIADILSEKRDIFISAPAPLSSLPFGVLVTEPPQGGIASDSDTARLRETVWLVKKHATVSLPSPASLLDLRSLKSEPVGTEPFAGFGNPYLKPAPNTARANAMLSLPNAENEMRMLALTLSASQTADVFLKTRATEAQVKTIDLSKKRVIAFATHTIDANFNGTTEPGLVFSTPQAETALDDGVLRPSEIARLHLRADWVILSACNTAGAGSKNVSALARAFFYAGAKSILATHWPIWDDSAAKLTSLTVANAQRTPSDGRAQALRRAMLTMLQDASHPLNAHPSTWGTFTLTGETQIGPNKRQPNAWNFRN